MAHAGHVPEQYVWGLDLDRTERNWQSPVFALEGYWGTSRPPTPRLTGHVTARQIPVPLFGGGRPGWDGGLSLGPRPPRIALRKLRRIARRHRIGVGAHNDKGWSDDGTHLGVPSLPLSGGRPLLAFSGSSRGWPACGRQVTPGKFGCGLPLRGAQGTRAVCRASVLLSWVLTEAGVKKAVHLCGPAPISSQSDATRKRAWQALAELAVRRGRGEQTPTPSS